MGCAAGCERAGRRLHVAGQLSGRRPDEAGRARRRRRSRCRPTRSSRGSGATRCRCSRSATPSSSSRTRRRARSSSPSTTSSIPRSGSSTPASTCRSSTSARRGELLVMGYRSPRKLCCVRRGPPAGVGGPLRRAAHDRAALLHAARGRPLRARDRVPRDEVGLGPGRPSSAEARLERVELRLRRERLARREVEEIAERTTRALYDKQQELILLEAVVARLQRERDGAGRTAGRGQSGLRPHDMARRTRLCARPRLRGPRAEHDLAQRAAGSVRGLSRRDQPHHVLRGGRAPGSRARQRKAGVDHRRDERPELPQDEPRRARRIRLPDPRGRRRDGGARVLHGARPSRPMPPCSR